MTERPNVPGSAVRVLLVEDSAAEADLVRDMLGREGVGSFTVTHVQRLALAIPHLRAGGVDLVLLDLNLPDSVGLSGFEELHPISPATPFIILTNVQNESVAARAVRMGAQDYLIKREVNERTLARAIRYSVERQRAEEALRASEERYALAVNGANDGLWDWNLASDTVYFSPRWKAILGYGEAEVGDRVNEWLDRVHPEDLERLRAALSEHLEGRTPHFECEHRVLNRSGEVRWVLTRGLAVRDAAGVAYRLAGSLSDITARKLAEEQLLHDAFHDALTGLANRALFLDRLEQTLRQHRRDPDRVFGVLFFDLDRFKNINDTLGHAVGDAVLKATARTIRGAVRQVDTVARLAGDEFTVLCENVDSDAAAEQIAQKLQLAFEQPLDIHGKPYAVRASIGLSMFPRDAQDAHTLLASADAAMYRVKMSRRNGIA